VSFTTLHTLWYLTEETIPAERLGLQWVADNIAAFGGDPEKVTIWGESGMASRLTLDTTMR
jgi:hypothetical protein